MNWFESIDRTPVTYIVLLAYVTLAILTDPFDPTGKQLVEYGACHSLLVQDGQAWRLLSAAFLHGGLLHLGFNSYCLVMFGPSLETSLGSVKFAILYIVAAIIGNVTANIWNWGLVVGGSGALFGMFGAVIAISMRRGRHLFEFLEFSGPRSILVMIGINLLIGMFIPMISNAAHVGGLVAGFVLMFVFLDRGRHGAPDRTGRVILGGWAALAISSVLYCLWPVGHGNFVVLRGLAQSIDERYWDEEMAKLHPLERAAYENLRHR